MITVLEHRELSNGSTFERLLYLDGVERAEYVPAYKPMLFDGPQGSRLILRHASGASEQFTGKQADAVWKTLRCSPEEKEKP